MKNDNKLTLEELVASGFTVEHLEAYLKLQNEKKEQKGDSRYNVPKEEPKVSESLIDKTISETEIYRKAKMLIMGAQRKQVGYGLDKYPKPLSADVWDILETIDHIVDESIDKLHYQVMLRIHLERLLAEQKASEARINTLEEENKMLREEIRKMKMLNRVSDDIRVWDSKISLYDKGTITTDKLNTHVRVDKVGPRTQAALDVMADVHSSGADLDGDRAMFGDQYGNEYIMKGGEIVRVNKEPKRPEY